MSPEQMFVARWLPAVTMGVLVGLAGYIALWREKGRRPSWPLTILTFASLVITACLWWRVFGR